MSSGTRDTETETDPTTAVLDVRGIDGEPFDAIVAALDDLAVDEQLLLVNSFEPEPLYGVLRNRGFEYRTDHVAADEWHVRITHQ